jgi:ABC-type amino acid transport substrate-binding protein
MRCHFTFDKRNALLITLLLGPGCAPADPEGTTDRIRASHVMRVGASENRPWIWFEQDQARGPEADMLNNFAASLGAQIRWTHGAESPLLKHLKERRLDVVAGGFTGDTPWKSDLGMTRPYAGGGLIAPGHVLLTAPGENGFLLRLDQFLASRHGA